MRSPRACCGIRCGSSSGTWRGPGGGARLATGLRPFRTTPAELVMRRGRRAAKRPRLGMAGVTESPLGAWGKMATTVVEPAAAVPAGSCPRTVTPGSRPQAHPEVPVVTESALPNPDEDRLKDLQETRAQIEQ